ncbi:hypothetical protein HPB48_019679 [Haemaphysalis longicornis]|uniref:Citrate transporter-like domain-containing protein n=1 Tax=Haemaphysalis longicornis TaxID=44386 RepID=A0A9J6G251_HAELO|nr:hypothetical protein HPB48_019679 [Haemaphysalis longicornis]
MYTHRLSLYFPQCVRNAAFQTGRQGFHSLYVVVTTALLWLVRPVPLCVSALFPIVALPLIGILDAETVCGLYFNRQGLQKRLTVACLRCLGGSIRCVLFVLMSTTALCAMMFSAPAAAHAAIPIVETLARELHRKPVHTAAAAEAPGEANEAIERHRGLVVLSVEEFSLGEERADSIRKVLLIAVVLSAIISAPASLTGASANMFLKGFLEMEKLEPGIHETVKGVVRTVTSAESEKLKYEQANVVKLGKLCQ